MNETQTLFTVRNQATGATCYVAAYSEGYARQRGARYVRALPQEVTVRKADR